MSSKSASNTYSEGSGVRRYLCQPTSPLPSAFFIGSAPPKRLFAPSLTTARRLITEATSTARPACIMETTVPRTSPEETSPNSREEPSTNATGRSTPGEPLDGADDGEGRIGRVYLGSAVCANSYHLLHHLGITHVLNATEADEVQAPPPEEGFVFMRCPVRGERALCSCCGASEVKVFV